MQENLNGSMEKQLRESHIGQIFSVLFVTSF